MLFLQASSHTDISSYVPNVCFQWDIMKSWGWKHGPTSKRVSIFKFDTKFDLMIDNVRTRQLIYGVLVEFSKSYKKWKNMHLDEKHPSYYYHGQCSNHTADLRSVIVTNGGVVHMTFLNFCKFSKNQKHSDDVVLSALQFSSMS